MVLKYLTKNEKTGRAEWNYLDNIAIFKDGRQIESFTNPIFNRFFVCNNNGKTIDTIEFSPIKKEE